MLTTIKRYWALFMIPFVLALLFPPLLHRHVQELRDDRFLTHALALMNVQPHAYLPSLICAAALSAFLLRSAAKRRRSPRALGFSLFSGCFGAGTIFYHGMPAMWQTTADPSAASWIFLTVIALICLCIALWAARAVIEIMWLDEED